MKCEHMLKIKSIFTGTKGNVDKEIAYDLRDLLLPELTKILVSFSATSQNQKHR